FIVADTGRMADTRSAVASIAKLLKSAPKKIQTNLERLGEITHQARNALEKASKQVLGHLLNEAQKELEALGVSDAGLNRLIQYALQEGDRKSTRLNSSHVSISYAVFCLKQ